MMIYICKFSIYLKDSFLGCRYNITQAYLIKFYIPLPPLFKFNPKPIYPKFKITKLNFSTSFIKIPKIPIIVNVCVFSDKVKLLHIFILSFAEV